LAAADAPPSPLLPSPQVQKDTAGKEFEELVG
jgi:hypothetical protein